eukprot:sb/3471891/
MGKIINYPHTFILSISLITEKNYYNKLPTRRNTLNLPLSAHLSRKSTSSILTRTTLLLVPRSATSVDLSRLNRVFSRMKDTFLLILVLFIQIGDGHLQIGWGVWVENPYIHETGLHVRPQATTDNVHSCFSFGICTEFPRSRSGAIIIWVPRSDFTGARYQKSILRPTFFKRLYL